MSQYQLLQGIGVEVWLVLFPAFIVSSYLIYVAWPYFHKLYVFLFGAGRENAQQRRAQRLFEDNQCSICLEQIKFPIAPTCGHEYCGLCLLLIYENTRARLNCPKCRKPVTTILRVFEPNAAPTDQETEIITKIRQYNRIHSDDRGIFRILLELPYLWGYLRAAVNNPRFFAFVLANLYRFRLVFLLLVYVISPLDILPESVLGAVGLIDDLLVILMIIAFVVQIIIVFIRQQH